MFSGSFIFTTITVVAAPGGAPHTSTMVDVLIPYTEPHTVVYARLWR